MWLPTSRQSESINHCSVLGGGGDCDSKFAAGAGAISIGVGICIPRVGSRHAGVARIEPLLARASARGARSNSEGAHAVNPCARAELPPSGSAGRGGRQYEPRFGETLQRRRGRRPFKASGQGVPAVIHDERACLTRFLGVILGPYNYLEETPRADHKRHRRIQDHLWQERGVQRCQI